MTQTATDRFRLRCRQFRWLAMFMVISVGGLLALMYLVAPTVLMMRGEFHPWPALWAAQIVKVLPSVFYLFAVWSIGSALGQLSKGRVIQPILVSAMRRVGLALGLGGLLSVFGVTNLMRLTGGHEASWAYFDVSGMTLGMIGGALFLLGGVMEQAGKVQAELDEMI